MRPLRGTALNIALAIAGLLLSNAAHASDSPDLPKAAAEIPVPSKRPDRTQAEPALPQAETPQVDTKPVKTPKPEDQHPQPDAGNVAPEVPAKPENPPIEREDEADYAACLKDLRDAGVNFDEHARIDDGNGCGIDKPLVVRDILPGVTLKPEATMRCKTALQLNRWIKGSVTPSGELAFGKDRKITSVSQATSYSCRNRNNAETGKLSEHARGNAIDIAGFTFSDGSQVEIAPREEDSTLTGAFERAITASGCLYFTTVLGPASDEAHQTHLHLDILARKGGYRYCW